MSDPSSCPNDQPHVGDRQVDVLAGFILRSDLGISEPSDAAWDRLQLRLTAPPVPDPSPPPGPSRAVRVQHGLLTTLPRMSSVGAALVLLIMFVNSSVHLLPPAFDPLLTTSVNQPVDTTQFVIGKMVSHGALAPVPDDWAGQVVNTTRLGAVGAVESVAVTAAPPPAADLPTGLADPSTTSSLRGLTLDERDPNLRRARAYRYVGTRQR